MSPRPAPATVEARTWTLTHRARPWTTNAERRGSRFERAANVRLWREAVWGLALEAKVGRHQRVRLTVALRLRGKRSMDIDACAPSLKAAIDGLVDARVIPDDGQGHIEAITILEPVLGAERDEFTITIEEVPLV
jgi:crossover junction endodeoxyribonuclease RusA